MGHTLFEPSTDHELLLSGVYLVILSKTVFWDSSGLQADRTLIENSFVEPSQKARFLAPLAPLPITNCGLRLDDEAVRVAVGVRVGLSLLCPTHLSLW